MDSECDNKYWEMPTSPIIPLVDPFLSFFLSVSVEWIFDSCNFRSFEITLFDRDFSK